MTIMRVVVPSSENIIFRYGLNLGSESICAGK
ncbi:Uncharacterised protein [Mycobacteroides abscessus subsp. abscessus]|nr:Uncharacterised protein [Mycobacteroides abscessus subsp. abscessus]